MYACLSLVRYLLRYVFLDGFTHFFSSSFELCRSSLFSYVLSSLVFHFLGGFR